MFLAGACFVYPALVSIQATVRHEHIAVMTGLYFATFRIATAVGTTVAGAIWSQTLTSALKKNLPTEFNNEATIASIYRDPLTYTTDYPTGTPLRDGMIESYKTVQRLLCITGICLAIPLTFFACILRNYKLDSGNKALWADEPDIPNYRASSRLSKINQSQA